MIALFLESATPIPEFLQYGALGLLALVLAGGFWLLRSVAAELVTTLRALAKTLADGETKAVERHAATHEKTRTIVREELEPVVEKLGELLDLPDVVKDSAKETRHSLRNAIHLAGVSTADHVEAWVAPLHRRLLGSTQIPAVKPPRPSTPDSEE
jgi:hypothetical protein